MPRETGNSIVGGYSEVGQTCLFQLFCNLVILLVTYTAVVLVTGPGKPVTEYCLYASLIFRYAKKSK